MNETDEAGIIRECLDGAHERFGILIERYQAVVFNSVYRLVHNVDDARDITQSTFLKALASLSKFDFRYRFYSWVYRIAVNESLNFLKRNHRLEPIDEQRLRAVRTPEDDLVGNEQDEIVQRSLMALPIDYRTVIVLRHFGDCSYAEMATILDIPEKTVKSRLFTARRMLQTRLARRSGHGNPVDDR